MTEAPRDSSPVILFDLDGTLVDTLPDLAGASNAFLAEHGVAPLSRERVQSMIGDGLLALAGKVMAAGGIKPEEPLEVAMHALRFRHLYEERHHADSVVYPDVRATLETLRDRGFRLTVCTNKVEAMAIDLLDQFGLGDLFLTVGGSDSFGARKPDPAHLRGVLDRLGATPAQAVMVGDTANDVRAAQGCRMRSIVVAYGYGLQGALASGPDMVVNGLADLPRVLQDMPAPGPGTA